MSNRTQKAETLMAMMDLVQRLQSKTRLLEALDDDVNAEDCCDLHDQLGTLTHSLARFEDAMLRANRVNGVEAEYDALFG